MVDMDRLTGVVCGFRDGANSWISRWGLGPRRAETNSNRSDVEDGFAKLGQLPAAVLNVDRDHNTSWL